MADSSGSHSTKPIDPFTRVHFACPICDSDTVHRYIKRSLYNERGKDIDLRPASIEWKKKELEEFHPQLYYFCHCSCCSFTAAMDQFKDPIGDYEMYKSTFVKLWKKANAEGSNQNNSQLLLQNLSADQMDFYQFFKLNLLAIHQLKDIKEITQHNSCNLGRYCLRLAWLYRTIRQSPTLVRKLAAPFQQLLKQLAPEWPDLPRSEPIALKMAATHFYTYLARSRKIETVKDEVSFLLLVTRINLQLKDIQEAHKSLQRAKESANQYAKEANDLIKKQEQAEKQRERNKDFRTITPKDTMEDVRANMLTESRRLKNLVGTVQNIFEDCREEHTKTQLAHAKKILKKIPDMEIAKKRQLLKERNITNDVIDMVLPPEKKQKKGIFGIFGS